MEEIDLKELVSLFWDKKLQIILIIAICAIIGLIYTVCFVTPVYTSSTTLVLSTADSSASSQSGSTITTTDITLNSKLISTYSELVKSKSVLRQVIANLGMANFSEDQLKKEIAVTSVSNTELIKISVTDENPTFAAKIANESATVFMEKVAEIYKINNVHVVDKAEVNEVPSNINHKKDIMMFAFVGIVIAILYVFVANMLDTTVKSSDEVEKNFKVPVIATIPLYVFEQSAKGGKKR